jgi:Ca-activated chloride channel family protein
MTSPTDQEARLTAFVLGELDETEAAEVRRRIESDADLAAEVAAIRETTDQLATAFREEVAPGLTQAQKDAIAGAGGTAPPPRRLMFPRRHLWTGIGLAAAACLVLALAVPYLSSGREGDSVAMNTRIDRSRKEPRPVVEGLVTATEPGGRGQPAPASGPSAPGASRGARGGKGGGGDETAVFLADDLVVTGGARAEGYYALQPVAPDERSTLALAPQLGVDGTTIQSSAPEQLERITAELRHADPESQVRRLIETPEVGGGVALGFEGEAYGRLVDNPFTSVADAPLSTFSIDVDTASYANVRRILGQGQRPPADAVRIEELINYFDYDYEPASGEHPFSVNTEINVCPWAPEHRLVRIGLRGREVDAAMRPATSLVFLIDVSGSMNRENKLPLLKQSMKMLIGHLNTDDRVAIVVYAGASGLVLPSTYCDEKETILAALDRLRAGGSTNGGAGIELAYGVAREGFIEGGVNRVILCTDGDFNVGVQSEAALVRLIEEKRESGVFLSVLGFGSGNWQDARMEQLSNHGNGNFAYIDTLREARKVLVEQMAGTLVTIAKDVKIQVDFNAARVGAYRLIGYANRLLAARDFNDDTKDAGEIGAGHTVTALYEIVPPGMADTVLEADVDPSKYQKPGELVESDELLTVKLRYKAPDGDESTPIEHPVVDEGRMLADASGDFQFAAAVASFGMLLRESPYKGNATWAAVLDLAAAGRGDDANGRRGEFIGLIEQARAIVDPPVELRD